jgi:outer membrane protein insertion porin family
VTLQIELVLNVVERKTGGLGMGGGLSTQARTEGSLPGFVGSFSYVERNLFGLNQVCGGN